MINKEIQKIEASAMYYALFLSVIFALLLGAFILFSGFNQNFALQMDVEEILIDNSNSGIAYGQTHFKEFESGKPFQMRLFGEGIDSVEITKQNWGAFTIIKSKAVHRNKTFTKLGLMGGKNKEDYPNLYLVDNGRPLSLSGNTRIEGDCKLPKSGLKRAYIEGKNYSGAKMVYGTVSVSEKQLPEFRTTFLEDIKDIKSEIIPWEDEVDSIHVSFAETPIHYIDDDIISLSQITIKGQAIIEAKDSIFIAGDAEIENAIIKSKVVYIASGFSGTAQIFASERIFIEDHVQLLYPSVLGITENVFPEERPAIIEIGEFSQVIGSVFLVSSAPNFRMSPQLSINKDAEIDGLIYCQGKTQLKGTINGHLFSSKMYLKTASSSYENHIVDGKLLNQLPAHFIAANLLDETTALEKIAWLK